MTHLLGIGGYAECGKDAFGEMFPPLGPWRKRRMSEPFEVGLLAIDPWINVSDAEILAMGISWGGYRPFLRYSTIHKAIGYERSKKIPEVRRFTQQFATEAGRDIHGEDCWTNIARVACVEDLSMGFSVVLTGVRMHEEIDMVREEGGIPIWVERPGVGPVNGHSSDNTLGPDDFDYVLANDLDLHSLAAHAVALDAILTHFTVDGEPPQLVCPSLPKFRYPESVQW